MKVTTIRTVALVQPLRDEHRELLPHIETLRKTADLIGESPAAAIIDRGR